MKLQTVGDVIGAPESWPNSLQFDTHDVPDMHGAIIVDIAVCGLEIAVVTDGGPCGETLSVFEIKDQALRDRTFRALAIGREVHAAVAAAL